MSDTDKSELPKLSDGDEELDYHLGNYPVVLADESGNEIEVRLCAIVEIDDLVQIFKKYGKGIL